MIRLHQFHKTYHHFDAEVNDALTARIIRMERKILAFLFRFNSYDEIIVVIQIRFFAGIELQKEKEVFKHLTQVKLSVPLCCNQ